MTITPRELNMDEETESKKQKITIKRLIVVAVFVIIGMLFVAGGASILFYNISENSPDGYAHSNVYHVNTSTYAFTPYMNQYKISLWGFLGVSDVAELKFFATPTDPKDELFIGYATTNAIQAYGDSFQREFPTNWHWSAEPYYANINITTTFINGTGAPAPPQNQTFWLAQAQSSGTVTMTYLPQHEQHVWFIMNSDGSRNISADIQIAFRSPILSILPPIIIVGGLILIGAGVYLLKRKKKN
jgi:LPXTG-motif cell wall-anchored protein